MDLPKLPKLKKENTGEDLEYHLIEGDPSPQLSTRAHAGDEWKDLRARAAGGKKLE